LYLLLKRRDKHKYNSPELDFTKTVGTGQRKKVDDFQLKESVRCGSLGAGFFGDPVSRLSGHMVVS